MSDAQYEQYKREQKEEGKRLKAEAEAEEMAHAEIKHLFICLTCGYTQNGADEDDFDDYNILYCPKCATPMK